MRLRVAIALMLLLIPSLSWGGAASKLRGVMGSGFTTTANSINGISSISSSGTMDTGTGNGNGTGGVEAYAACTGTGGGASVYLVINGSVVDSLTCDIGLNQSKTLTSTVSGLYTARVYGTKFGTGTFTANNFVFP